MQYITVLLSYNVETILLFLCFPYVDIKPTKKADGKAHREICVLKGALDDVLEFPLVSLYMEMQRAHG